MALSLGVFFLLMLLISPERCSSAAQNALIIWGLDVVPSLFPYMVMCRLIARYAALSRIPVHIAAPLLGLMGGSPSGASVLSVYILNGNVKEKAIPSFIALVCGISPAFLLTTIGQWGFSRPFCLLLYAVHLLACVLSAAAIRIVGSSWTRIPPASDAPGKSAGSDNAIMASVLSVLGVGGCIVFFSVAGEWASILLGRYLPDVIPTVIHASLEMSGGMMKISLLPASESSKFVLCAAVSGFSGFSILTQNHHQLSDTGISMKNLLFCAVLRAVFSVLLAMIIIALLPSVFSAQ